MPSQPLVSIVMPAYNAAEFLAEAIESVVAQTYENWDFTIVNNCSTDRTLEIAQSYARNDSRIRVQTNQKFVAAIPNHNNAFRATSPRSKYCKMLLADDLLFPECLARMVQIAEANPSVGLVGAYGQGGTEVLWAGLPLSTTFVLGREICRATLLGGPYVFGTPTSTMIRSDIVRGRDIFFEEDNLHSDYQACFDVLQSSDFGFVHQVLTHTRPRRGSLTSFAQSYNSYFLGILSILTKYGPLLLTEREYKDRLEFRLNQYYRFLAKNKLRLREQKFWEYHGNRMKAIGYPIDRARLFKALLAELLDGVAHPRRTMEGVLDWWPRAFLRTRGKASSH